MHPGPCLQIPIFLILTLIETMTKKNKNKIKNKIKINKNNPHVANSFSSLHKSKTWDPSPAWRLYARGLRTRGKKKGKNSRTIHGMRDQIRPQWLDDSTKNHQAPNANYDLRVRISDCSVTPIDRTRKATGPERCIWTNDRRSFPLAVIKFQVPGSPSRAN